MAIRLTGLTEIAIGSWEFYKAREAFNKGLISEEQSSSRKIFNRTKVGIGALKIMLIGYSASSIVAPLLDKANLTNYEIGILSTFAAGYAVLAISDIYSAFLNDEAINYKYHQSNLEKKFKIKLNENIQLNSYEAYQLYMFGNKLSTGNSFDSFIFKIKNKINDWKENFNIEHNSEFGIIRNKIYKILQLSGLKKIMDSIYSKSVVKKDSFNTLKEFVDINSKPNQEFLKHIKLNKKEILLDEDSLKKELKDINQKAIINAYQKNLIQNLQLFFSQSLIDYKNTKTEDRNKSLMLKFSKLKEQNTLKSGDLVLIQEYSKISKIATNILNGDHHLLNKFQNPEDVLKYIDSQCLDKNGNIIILKFDNMFKLERKAILNKENGLSKLNENIYEDKKGFFTEINFNTNVFSKIKINQAKNKDKTINKNLKNE